MPIYDGLPESVDYPGDFGPEFEMTDLDVTEAKAGGVKRGGRQGRYMFRSILGGARKMAEIKNKKKNKKET
jgi:hypothetical protein